MTTRHVLTTNGRLLVILRYARCPECGEGFSGLADVTWDHIGQLHFTEDNDLSNFRPIHRMSCDKVKTAKDAAARGKARRLSKEQEETRRRITEPTPRKPRSKIPSRPWPKRKRTT